MGSDCGRDLPGVHPKSLLPVEHLNRAPGGEVPRLTDFFSAIEFRPDPAELTATDFPGADDLNLVTAVSRRTALGRAVRLKLQGSGVTFTIATELEYHTVRGEFGKLITGHFVPRLGKCWGRSKHEKGNRCRTDEIHGVTFPMVIVTPRTYIYM